MQERKPVFLAPDFDRWLDESDAEMEIREKVIQAFYTNALIHMNFHVWDMCIRRYILMLILQYLKKEEKRNRMKSSRHKNGGECNCLISLSLFSTLAPFATRINICLE